ncbi:uncharacterized protein LOC131650311 [Vicia villosa]|uniref:uncharacterized protein LOC131650311 n=1 Tax=Vicia villosa TaxID=3911 RepID=UPI00273C2FDE|nr:uncharacterized protein LOC131650311 [Vicia villosa]
MSRRIKILQCTFSDCENETQQSQERRKEEGESGRMEIMAGKVERNQKQWREVRSSGISGVAKAVELVRVLADQSSNSVLDFQFLKSFNIKVNFSKAFIVKEFLWHPLILNWLKCNTDGAATVVPQRTACGGIFRDHTGKHHGSFSKFLGSGNAYWAELSGAILAIEIARQKNWTNLWLETDSKLVVLAFSKPDIVPWTLRNRWENVIHHTRSINFSITHIYRE